MKSRRTKKTVPFWATLYRCIYAQARSVYHRPYRIPKPYSFYLFLSTFLLFIPLRSRHLPTSSSLHLPPSSPPPISSSSFLFLSYPSLVKINSTICNAFSVILHCIHASTAFLLHQVKIVSQALRFALSCRDI